MKLTKKLEAEILKVHNAYWHNYLEGDVEAMHPLLADEYTQVGSAEGEVFSNKKEAVQFLYDTIEQVAGKLEMRNRKTTVEQLENAILIHEFCDLYALADKNWIFYSKFRASTLMQEKKEGWRIIHQHSSFPDTRAEDGQNIAIDKIAEENLQLREAIKRRTIELEQKNRELEIDAALERVRAAAMAMRDSSELGEIINKLYGELTKLDAKLDRCFIMIVNPENKGITWWLAGKEGLLAENGFFIPMNEHPTHLMYLDNWKKRKKKWHYLFEGREKRDWDRFGFSKTELAKLPNFIKEDMAAVKKIHLSGSSEKFGSLVTGSIEPLTDEHQEIISRFTIAFNQAYIRFLDLQKAEAQAREARIEAALERIRSRSMALQKSSELLDIIRTVFGEWKKLGLELYECNINLFDRDNKVWTNWGTGIGDAALPSSFLFPWFEDPFVNQLYEDTCKGISWRTYSMRGENKHMFLDSMFSKTDFKNAPEEYREALYNIPELYLTHAFMQYGSMDLVGPGSPPESIVDILKRFAKVFEQAYTRFLDLQKAEAQAKESQIQLSLERVRARTMAMHKSDELADVVGLLHKQFEELGFDLYQILILIFPLEKEKKQVEWWGRGFWNNESPQRYIIPFTDHPFQLAQQQKWKSGEIYYAHILDGDIKKSWEKYLFTKTDLKNFPEGVKKQMQSVKKIYLSDAFMKYGVLQAAGPEPLPQDKTEILIRFAKVLDQSYTRFLDLQKAEAQAREAQIEAALERVRSKTMAMQNSKELPEAANLLFQQIQSLGMPAWSAGYCIWDEDKQGITLWMSSEGIMQPSFHTQLTEDPSFIHMKQAYEKGEAFHVEEVGGEALVSHYQYMRTLPVVGKILDSIIDAGHPLPVFQIFHCVYFPQGFLLFITYEQVPEAHEIFKRFGRVFEQTYTRFLDLQKAETQAKESELEKKRSEDLLLNILPREIANELKQFGKSYARKHEQVSILFTDIKGFSTISETLSAEELVNQLDECFRAFDNIVGKHGLEKIKTVGDAYICACGLPNPDPDNAVKTVRAAIDMLDFAKGFGMTKVIQDLPKFEFRVGIHTGPVITGVVGLKKFTYDIWGDAVNMAARMEQHGEAGKINISGNTYQLIKDKFICSHRGKILAKNKGEVDMYFVERKKD